MQLSSIYRSYLAQLAILALSLWVSFKTLEVVLFENLKAGVYPAEADSIGIPIIGYAIETFLVFGLSVIALAIPNKGIWSKIRLLPLAAASLFAGVSAFGFADPNHWQISIACSVVLLVLMAIGYQSWRNSPK